MDAFEEYVKEKISYYGFVPETFETKEQLNEAVKELEDRVRKAWNPATCRFSSDNMNREYHYFCAGLEKGRNSK